MKIKLNKKLNAFTLTELMIALSITSVVMMICILSYSLIHKQFIEYNSASSDITAIYQFLNTIENDQIYYQLDTIDGSYISFSNYNDHINYDMNEAYILRFINSQTDTIISLEEYVTLEYRKDILSMILSLNSDSLTVMIETKRAYGN